MSFIIRGCWLLAQPQRNRIRTWTKSLLFLPVFPLLTQFCLGSTLICNDTLQVSFCQSVFNFWAQIVQVLLESFLFSEVVNNNKAFPSSREQLYDNQVKMECKLFQNLRFRLRLCFSCKSITYLGLGEQIHTKNCIGFQLSCISDIFLIISALGFDLLPLWCPLCCRISMCPKAFSFISQMYCLHALHSSMCSIPTFSPTLQEFL